MCGWRPGLRQSGWSAVTLRALTRRSPWPGGIGPEADNGAPEHEKAAHGRCPPPGASQNSSCLWGSAAEDLSEGWVLWKPRLPYEMWGAAAVKPQVSRAEE